MTTTLTRSLAPNGRTDGAPRVLLIGVARTLDALVRQFEAVEAPVKIIGAALFHDAPDDPVAQELGIPVLGSATELERLVGEHTIELAIVSLPAVMSEAIAAIRTTLRRLGIPDRFIATLDDQLAGVGPRSVFEVDIADLIDRSPHRVDEASIRHAVGGKRVLITGAGGSIGSELARTIARYGPSELFLMERSENALFEIDRQIARSHPDLPRGAWLHDVTDDERTLGYLVAAKPQIILHAAAHKHVPMMEDHPIEAVVNNFFGTKSIVDAAAQTACERFVMISTDKAVNPSSVMGATKRLAELYVQFMNQRSDTRFSLVRFGNVLGSAGSVLPIWGDQLRHGGPLTVTDPRMTRFFMTIPEAAALVIQAAALDELDHDSAIVPGGETLILDMGKPISILEMAKRFIRAHGLEPIEAETRDRPRGADTMRIVFTGVRPGEKLHEELAYADEDLLPTAHPGIHIWKSTAPSEERIGDLVATLEEVRQRGAPDLALNALSRLVPETTIPSTEIAPRGRALHVA
ncbi:MAG: polysaccharide biosynthesis protein [Phycisphaerales bacterium]